MTAETDDSTRTDDDDSVRTNEGDPETDLDSEPEVGVSEKIIDVDSHPEFLEEGLDPFAGLFVNEDDENFVCVRLRRIAPKGSMLDPVTNTLVPFSGSLGDLPPGLISYDGFIRDTYGGGTYLAAQIGRLANGKMVIRRQKKLVVAGIPPKLPRSAQVTPGAQDVPSLPAPAVRDLGTLKLSGVEVPLGLGNDDLLVFVTKMKMLKEFFPDPVPVPDINSALLERILSDRSEPMDPTRMIESLGSIVGAVRELAGGGGDGGSDWAGLINNALTTVQKMVGEASGPTSAGLRKVAPGVSAPIALPDNSGSKPIDNQETATMSMMQIAQSAIANIVAGFQLEPRMSSDDLVGVLDDVLSLSKEVRAQLNSYRSKLWNMARLTMSDYFAENDGSQAEFKSYFDAVFDLFVDPERSSNGLAG